MRLQAWYLVGFTVLAWLAHAGLSFWYGSMVPNSRGLLFRAIHVLDIFIITVLMVTAYRSLVRPSFGWTEAVGIITAVLLILDLGSLWLIKRLRQRFDLWHFVAAYAVIVLAVGLAYRIRG